MAVRVFLGEQLWRCLMKDARAYIEPSASHVAMCRLLRWRLSKAPADAASTCHCDELPSLARAGPAGEDVRLHSDGEDVFVTLTMDRSTVDASSTLCSLRSACSAHSSAAPLQFSIVDVAQWHRQMSASGEAGPPAKRARPAILQSIQARPALPSTAGLDVAATDTGPCGRFCYKLLMCQR